MNHNTNINLLAQAEEDKKELELQMQKSFSKYTATFCSIESSLLKRNTAFLKLISAIVSDILKNLKINYDTDVEVINLHTRRLFESLLVLCWMNRHTPKEIYRQFAKEQISFCEEIKASEELIPEANAVLDKHIQLAVNGAKILGIIGIETEKLIRINFKDEAKLAQLEDVYKGLYNISSVLLHGGIFSAKFRTEYPPNLHCKNLLFQKIIEILPRIHQELRKIQHIPDRYQ